ncbi:type-F conjugative transfer system protein TrbI [Enterobacter asburiae]|uniref:type-F conjugative transfer system protein TrbI n=1 Tax=Enterobacter asburiae TaxID=61645 RepID=UPI00192BC8F8|nr:type-F conjugative transfer system protein TrbI [Enterobacter asburiae]MBL5950191.1 type-F conjugative transfer system protein TrbI [Enterobacter asburiae]MDW3573188.1 type-F conjugative transfer system protein TrbI [Enterobacter asburiae]
MTTEQNLTTEQPESNLSADAIRKGVNIPAKGQRRDQRRRRCLRNLLLVALTILCINAAITSLLISWRAPVVVSFDMKGTVDRFTGQLAERSLSEEQTTALTERFMTALGDAVHAWQIKHDALVLVEPAVVGGARDITEEIQSTIAEKMADGGW